jgi:hypothetical protein
MASIKEQFQTVPLLWATNIYPRKTSLAHFIILMGYEIQLEVDHFSKNNFSKNSKNDIQFFEKFRKISKKIEK